MAQILFMVVDVHTLANNGMGFITQPPLFICLYGEILVSHLLVILQKNADISNFFSKTLGHGANLFYGR